MAMSYIGGPSQADYEERIDFERLRRERLARAEEAMKKHDLDAVLVWRDENVRYLTSARVIMLQYRASTHCGALLPRGGEPILFISGGDYARAKLMMPWIHRMEPIALLEEPGLVEHYVEKQLKEVLAAHGLLDASIGIDMMTYTQLSAYRRFLQGVEWRDGDEAMKNARIIKTGEEIKVMEIATAIAEAVTARAIKSVAEGRRECEVAGDAMQTLFSLGAELSHTASPFVASGERMSPPTRFSSDKIIRSGDLVFIDIGACWNGYFSDIGRTVICGKPSNRQREIYRAVYEALMAAINQMKPGVRISRVAGACREKAAEHGLEKNFIHLFIGHGVGVSPNEPPYVGEPIPGASDVVLEAGMTLAIEPLIWVPGIQGGGGVRLEDTILITEHGPHILSRSPYDEALLYPPV